MALAGLTGGDVHRGVLGQNIVRQALLCHIGGGLGVGQEAVTFRPAHSITSLDIGPLLAADIVNPQRRDGCFGIQGEGYPAIFAGGIVNRGSRGKDVLGGSIRALMDDRVLRVRGDGVAVVVKFQPAQDVAVLDVGPLNLPDVLPALYRNAGSGLQGHQNLACLAGRTVQGAAPEEGAHAGAGQTGILCFLRRGGAVLALMPAAEELLAAFHPACHILVLNVEPQRAVDVAPPQHQDFRLGLQGRNDRVGFAGGIVKCRFQG